MTYTLVDEVYSNERYIETIYLDSLGIPTYGIGTTVYNNTDVNNPVRGGLNWTTKEMLLILDDNMSGPGKRGVLPYTTRDGKVWGADQAGLKALMDHQYAVELDMVNKQGRKFQKTTANWYVTNYPANEPKFYISPETAFICMMTKLLIIERDIFKYFPWLALRSQQLVDAYIRVGYQMNTPSFYRKFPKLHLHIEDYNFIGAHYEALYGVQNNTNRDITGLFKTTWYTQTPQVALYFLTAVAYDLADAYERVIKNNSSYRNTREYNAKKTEAKFDFINKIKKNYNDMIDFEKGTKFFDLTKKYLDSIAEKNKARATTDQIHNAYRK